VRAGQVSPPPGPGGPGQFLGEEFVILAVGAADLGDHELLEIYIVMCIHSFHT